MTLVIIDKTLTLQGSWVAHVSFHNFNQHKSKSFNTENSRRAEIHKERHTDLLF